MKLQDIPKSRKVFLDSGDVLKFMTTMDDFFRNTRDYVESVHDSSRPHDFRIKSGEINYDCVSSNDRLTYLFYDDCFVLAGVIETRTPLNHLRYTFFRDLGCLEEEAISQ